MKCFESVSLSLSPSLSFFLPLCLSVFPGSAALVLVLHDPGPLCSVWSPAAKSWSELDLPCSLRVDGLLGIRAKAVNACEECQTGPYGANENGTARRAWAWISPLWQEKQRENYLVMKTKKKKTTWRCCFAKYMRTADAKYAQTFAVIYLIQVDKPLLKKIY